MQVYLTVSEVKRLGLKPGTYLIGVYWLKYGYVSIFMTADQGKYVRSPKFNLRMRNPSKGRTTFMSFSPSTASLPSLAFDSCILDYQFVDFRPLLDGIFLHCLSRHITYAIIIQLS